MRRAWTSIIWWSLASVAFCQNDPVFRSEARFVTVDVQVLSHNRPIIGLLQKDFLLHDDGVPQTITNFGSEDQPLDIMLLVDVSSSTDEIDAVIQNEAAHAMDRLRKGDRVGVAVFANSAYLAIPLTAERDQLIAGISNQAWRSMVPRQGVTELNRTTVKTANYLRKNARAGARRAIVVLTDNQVAGYVSENAAREALWEADAVLSAIVFAGMPDYGSFGADVRPFAQATGGEVMKAGGRGSKLAEMLTGFESVMSCFTGRRKASPGVSIRFASNSPRRTAPVTFKSVHAPATAPANQAPIINCDAGDESR